MKTENSITTVYPNKYYENNITGSVVTTYYYLGDKLVANRQGTTLSYVLQDALGSTSASVNSSGTVTSTIKYFSFGSTRSSTGTLPTDKLFTGQRQDNTGLYYYGARYYDPEIGRFISADTIVPTLADPQTLNRYSYCLNNPLNHTDPSGHWSLKEQLTGSWQVCLGYKDAVVNTVKATVQMIMNPVGTVENIVKAVSNPGETWNTIKVDYSEKLQSNRGFGEIVGETLIFAGTCGAGVAVGSSSKIAEAANIASKEVGVVEKTSGIMKVYNSFDEATGEVNYIGMTNNLERRAAEQLRDKGIEIYQIKGLSGLSYADARAVEQVLIEYYGLPKNGGAMLNKINSISKLNPIYGQSVKTGKQILDKIGYFGK